ncbi:MAG: lipopolysaccharide biosynthesis protein, partial [Bacteroidales bacterium]
FIKFIFFCYLLLSPITFFIEYIYLLHNLFVKIYSYGIISYIAQFLLVVIPSFIYNDLAYSLWGLLIIIIIRLLWLLILVLQFANIEFSWQYVKNILKNAQPLILGAFIAGSMPYIDGVLVSMNFDDTVFAVFRYGARELPISILLASAFSNAMIPILNSTQNFTQGLLQLKRQALQLMHILYPLSILLLFTSYYLFKYVFNPNFIESAHIFNIMLLLVIPRMLFPQTILMAKGQNSYLLIASAIEFLIKLVLSIWLLSIMRLKGIAFATFLAFIFEKIILMYFVKKQNNISPHQYTYLNWFFIYTFLILIVYVLVEKIISYN